MFRKIFSVQICLLLFSANQTVTAEGRDSTEQYQPKKILIIPYEQRMYLSDADHDISEYSDRSPEEIRAMFRMGLTEKLNAKLVTSYRTHSLLQDLQPEAMQDLDRIYGAIDYSFDTSYVILHPKPDSAEATGKWNEKKARKKELEKRTATGDVRYMNVKILDPHLLTDLSKKYGADEFVFLSQAEIKTNAKDCIDFQGGIYQRDLKVHYSVYDKDGNQLYGDVAVVKFPSNSNEVGEIMEKNFPTLGSVIKEALSRN